MLPGKQLGIPAILGMLRRHIWKLVVPPIAGLFLKAATTPWFSSASRLQVE